MNNDTEDSGLDHLFEILSDFGQFICTDYFVYTIRDEGEFKGRFNVLPYLLYD